MTEPAAIADDFDVWHVSLNEGHMTFGAWERGWCNRCAMSCTGNLPCDCCDLDQDTA